MKLFSLSNPCSVQLKSAVVVLSLAPHFIVSTGKTHPDAPTEAAIMKTELIDYGIPDSCTTVEVHSVNTLENAIEVAKLRRTDKYKQARAIALISNSYHLRRMNAFLMSELNSRRKTPSPYLM